MDENQDVGGSAFEDRIRTLFEGGTSWRNVSAASVVRGARRRRVRHRATAAGASFAVLGVAAAGMVAFGGNPAGRGQATGTTPTPTTTTTTTATATPPASTSPTGSTPAPSTSSTSGAATCSASVGGTVPALTPTTADGLDFETVSGSTAGIPWSVKIHTFPNWQTYLDWYKTQAPPRVPDSSSDSHPGQPPALFRQSGSPELMPVLIPGDSFGFVGHRLRGGADSPKKYVVQGWTAATIDHLCLQFAHHAEFEPVYRIQGGTFAVFGYTTADEPQKAIGYDAAGHVVATLDGDAGLLMPSGLQY